MLNQLRRRVVVSGMGMACPLGTGVRVVWKRLVDGQSGIGRLPDTGDFTSLPCKVAGMIPQGTGPGDFNMEAVVRPSEAKGMVTETIYGIAATGEALEDANWRPSTDEDSWRTGVIIGCAVSGSRLDIEYSTNNKIKAGQLRRVTPYLIPMILPNLVAGHLSIRYKLKGPTLCVSTACATGAHAVGDAASLISRGVADVMVAGAVEFALHPVQLAGFCRAQALCTKFNDNPQSASRPFDARRAGFVPSEGVAVLVLEELKHARSRGARIYAEVLGYGLSGDGYHISSPPADGNGAQRSMKGAIADAGIKPEDVTHINVHSTSTPVGDRVETFALKQVFGRHVYDLIVYAPKGALGHTLGAAGAVEMIVTVLSVKNGLVPPNLNLEEKEPEFDLNYPTGNPTEWKCENGKRRIALTNSFGFGGTNGTLCVGEYIE